jgi:hypothetical protein
MRSHTSRSGQIASLLVLISLLSALTALPQPVVAADGPPTVNGLFWGDGDWERYGDYYAKATASDSKLYRFVDGANERLYVALVVDGNFNDNVFDYSLTPYMESAGWNRTRSIKELLLSDHAVFELYLTCDGTTEFYTWGQGYAKQGNANWQQSSNTATDWWSGQTGQEPSIGAPPAGIDQSSSLVWNMNHYAVDPRFDMNVNGPAVANWKSAFDATNPNTVVDLDGWPDGGVISSTAPITFSETYQWEWAMVYEWSVPLPAGCSYRVTSPLSHHSPSKPGGEND